MSRADESDAGEPANPMADARATADADADTNDTLAIAAHEIKNALGPLAMTLQLCDRQAADGKPVSCEDLAFARAQVRRIGQMVNDLLDAARVDSGQLALRLAPVDLCGLVSGAVDVFHRMSPRRTTCDVPATPIVCVADGERLTAVLANFLDNAAKYAPEPSPIEVRLGRTGAHVRISVTDHGPGIASDDQQRLFQRYFRAARTADAARGLGLGLYLCRMIADGHGGTVGVDSTPGRGSTFWIDLTLAQT
jgi:signal transduction histidine kinase